MQRPYDAMDDDRTLMRSELDATVIATPKRRTALLTGLPGTTPSASNGGVAKEVADLADHREKTILTQTLALQRYMVQDVQQAPVAPEPSASVDTNSQSQAPQASPQAPQQVVAPTPAATTQAPVKAGAEKKRGVLGRKRVPVLQQMEAVECGAACLAMILSYYGRKTSVSEMRDFCGVGRDGLTALNIVKAARAFQLRVRAVSLKENDFRAVTLPAIVHWEFNHFLIVERWTPQFVDLVDPGMGRRRVSAAEFDQSFTGVVIMLEPGVNFNRSSESQQVSLRSYIANFVRIAPFSLLQILGASLLLQLFGLAIPALTAIVVDQVIPLGLQETMPLLGLGLLILVFTQTVTGLLRASVLLYLQTRVDTQMILSFFEQLLQLPLRFFQQRSSGDILSRLSSNSIIRDTVSSGLISTVLDGSFVIVYFFILLSQSRVISLLAVAIGLLQVVLMLTTNRMMRDFSRRELLTQAKAQSYMAEALAGMDTLKAIGAEQQAMEHWSNLFFDQMNISVRHTYVASLVGSVMNLLTTFAPLALLWVGTLQVLGGQLQVGTMLALNALAIAFLSPLGSLVASGQKLQLVHAHLERIADVMETQPEQDTTKVQQPPKLSGDVRLEHVMFTYDQNSPPILHDIDLTIKPGHKVAIVGRTGSGKSTLGKLLLGMYLPTQGEIYYDGIPLSKLNYQLVRSQFGVVMQETSIFSGTVRENIALASPATGMERVIKSAQIAAIHEDIMRMPMEYETFVSEGGSALSGGQRQRLALARALVRQPAVLLLDEATSSLDVVTEQTIERNLRWLPCTQIVIAHRLSMVRNADMIVVMHEGTIVESGSHQELVRRNGYYAKLIQSQLTSGEIQSS